MYHDHSVGVVIPAYNEREFIGGVLEAVPAFVDRIYVVDDCSTDGTWEAVGRFVRSRVRESADGAQPADGPSDMPDIVPIRHRTNRGAGGAIKTGYRRAVDDGMEVTVTIDADGQMDPRAMVMVIDPIVYGVADYAKGNRLTTTSRRAGMPRFRWVGNWMLTFLTKVASGYWRMRDPQNGYTAISYRALAAIDVDDIFEYYGYVNDVLVRLNAAEMRVADVTMPTAYGDEESHISYTSYIPKVSVLLLRDFLWRLRVRYLGRTFHPLAVFYLLGFVGAGLLLVYAMTVVLTAESSGDVLPGLLGALPILGACGVSTAIGMALDRQKNRPLQVRVR